MMSVKGDWSSKRECICYFMSTEERMTCSGWENQEDIIEEVTTELILEG